MKAQQTYRFPGTRAALDGNSAVIRCERESTDAAGAYPITPSTQMGEYWAEAAAQGHINVSGRPLIFIEPEGYMSEEMYLNGISSSLPETVQEEFLRTLPGLENVRAQGRELFLWPGHRLHARVAVRGGGQASDLRAEYRRPGHDQGVAERSRRP